MSFFHVSTTHVPFLADAQGPMNFSVDFGDGTFIGLNALQQGTTNWDFLALSGSNSPNFHQHLFYMRYRMEDVAGMGCGSYVVTARCSVDARLRVSANGTQNWLGNPLDDPFHAIAQIQLRARVLINDGVAASENEVVHTEQVINLNSSTFTDLENQMVSVIVPFDYDGAAPIDLQIMPFFALNSRGQACQAAIEGLPGGASRCRVSVNEIVLS
ncbi:MAG: hypothetical protein ACE5JX_21330 [Acidobacteriota bacterium]